MSVVAQPVLRVDSLRTRLGVGADAVTVVDGVSLELGSRQILALLGESGSGKTMTALSILGLLPPGGRVVDGQVRYRDHDLLAISARERRRLRGRNLAMVFQNPRDRLDPLFTIGRQLVEVLLEQRVSETRADARARAIELLEGVHLPRATEVAGRYPHQLSGGMLQRVTIAMAVASSPELLIADEATSALDVTIQSEILDLLAELRTAHGMSILFITHDIGVARAIADSVAVMYAGQIVEHGPAEEVLRAPEHPYTRALLDCVPGESRQVRPIPGRAANLRALPPGCRFASRCQERDRHGKAEQPPPLVRHGDRLVRCWLYEERT